MAGAAPALFTPGQYHVAAQLAARATIVGGTATAGDLIDIAFDQRGAGQRHGQHLAQMLQKREQNSSQAARIFLVLSIGSQYQNS